MRQQIDSFTASVLTEHVKEGNADEVLALYKDLCTTHDGGPSDEVISLVTSLIGKKCKVKHTSHIGVVEGVNRSTGGFYNGGRYPVFVKITKSRRTSAVGKVFEYELSQIEIINKEKK